MGEYQRERADAVGVDGVRGEDEDHPRDSGRSAKSAQGVLCSA